MTITTKHITEKEITLTPPLFWADKRRGGSAIEMVALIDDHTAIALFITDGYASIKNSEPAYADIQGAYNNFQPITEEEFFAALATAVERVSLKPVLTEKVCA